MLREIYNRLIEQRCDAWAHLMMGYIIVISLCGLGVNAVLAVVACVGFALGKEEYDKCHPETHTFDPLDFSLTTVGGTIGIAYEILRMNLV